ncbi:hypothetical protein [Eubacterium oxidoreducens]|uniref:Uncharacterized protein n=1 Tax=Eubacterium oxidoreducens TaxID=1732 RepID=A0A1G6B3E5_EUBOX|nr:hypothetical protein [Eubacterium oxidoreducens]SDB15190.1 hypothetical protein SAMN02910417_01123 [Eubacterium oxidoreducens]
MTGEELKQIKKRAFNEGIASVWKDIAKVTSRQGDYNCLYNAIHGTEKYPNGFNVQINPIHE